MPTPVPAGSTTKIALYAVLASDHLTPATGKTIVVTISKDGAAFGNPSGGATNATEIGSGWYYFTPSATDTGTLGPLIVLGTSATIDNSTRDLMVETNIASQVWQDAVAGDFTVSSSIGKSLYTSGIIPGAAGGLFISGTNAATTVNITGNITGNLSGSVGSVTGLTTATIATAVWQDATAGDFTTASSIGKALYVANIAPGGSGGHLISGSNAGTTTLGALTVTGATTHTGTTTYTGAVANVGGWSVGGVTIPNLVWNEVNTAAVHNVTNSTGKQLRSIAVNTGVIYVEATPVSQAGMTSSQIKLSATASAVNNVYQYNIVSILSGTDAGDSATITSYDGPNRIISIAPATWVVQPDVTSIAEITPAAQVQVASYSSGQAPLQPTVAGRTLDVSTTGEAGLDWANVGSPTTAVALTNTTISTSQVVASVAGAVGSVSGLTLTGGGVTLADGVAHGGTPGSSTATFAMQSMSLYHPTGLPLDIEGRDGGAFIYGGLNGGSGPGMEITGGDTGESLLLEGGNFGINIVTLSGPGIAIATQDGDGIQIIVTGTNVHAVNAAGGTISGDAFHLTATDGSGLKCVGGGGKPAIVPGSLGLGL